MNEDHWEATRRQAVAQADWLKAHPPKATETEPTAKPAKDEPAPEPKEAKATKAKPEAPAKAETPADDLSS